MLKAVVLNNVPLQSIINDIFHLTVPVGQQEHLAAVLYCTSQKQFEKAPECCKTTNCSPWLVFSVPQIEILKYIY